MNRASSVSLSAALAVSLLAGCSDQIVYRDRPAFTDPPAGAGGFLGFSDETSKRTTCGNCHSGKQATWQGTAHARAWDDLVASGAKKTECEACHSVSDRGNATTDATAGYSTSHNARYYDVQCESCHGPGLTHVTNPDVAASKPLASIAVGTSLTNGCGECHSGEHQPFVEQWAASRHARVIDSRATNASCQGCHEPRAVLAAWGVKSNYTELTQSGPPYMGITCVVCHDPHDARNPSQLRFRIDVPELESNLCMKCHYRRAAPEVASSSGPHSPQGPVLLGEAGWIPPNFQYPPGSLIGSHGSDRNPKLCATCHVNSYQITGTGGQLTFRATGHRFQPIPCVDAQGIPTGSTTCTDAERSFKACVSCHLSETAARSARAVAKQRLSFLADQVDSLLKRVPANQFSTTDNRITTAEGSKFNMQLARELGSPIHNPFLVEALLIASIQQIGIDYGLTSTASLSPRLLPPPSLARRDK